MDIHGVSWLIEKAISLQNWWKRFVILPMSQKCLHPTTTLSEMGLLNSQAKWKHRSSRCMSTQIWDTYLQSAVCIQNNSMSETTRDTPIFLILWKIRERSLLIAGTRVEEIYPRYQNLWLHFTGL